MLTEDEDADGSRDDDRAKEAYARPPALGSNHTRPHSVLVDDLDSDRSDEAINLGRVVRNGGLAGCRLC